MGNGREEIIESGGPRQRLDRDFADADCLSRHNGAGFAGFGGNTDISCISFRQIDVVSRRTATLDCIERTECSCPGGGTYRVSGRTVAGLPVDHDAAKFAALEKIDVKRLGQSW